MTLYARSAIAVVIAAVLLTASAVRSPAQNIPFCPFDASTKTKSWVSAQERIAAKGLSDNRRQLTESRRERMEIAYIRACGALGDYYALQHAAGTLPDLSKAMAYYETVIYLKVGTDGDIGDDNSFLERNKVCCRVASLYNTGRLDPKDLKSAYVGHFIDARVPTVPSLSPVNLPRARS